MPVINAHTLETGTLKGEDHGATISLILDNSQPGQGPRLHRYPYDETWSSRKERSPSSSATRRSALARATSLSPHPTLRTS